MKKDVTIKQTANGFFIVMKESHGLVKAITYSRDMTENAIKASLKNNPPRSNEWKPYNQTFGMYC